MQIFVAYVMKDGCPELSVVAAKDAAEADRLLRERGAVGEVTMLDDFIDSLQKQGQKTLGNDVPIDELAELEAALTAALTAQKAETAIFRTALVYQDCQGFWHAFNFKLPKKDYLTGAEVDRALDECVKEKKGELGMAKPRRRGIIVDEELRIDGAIVSGTLKHKPVRGTVIVFLFHRDGKVLRVKFDDDGKPSVGDHYSGLEVERQVTTLDHEKACLQISLTKPVPPGFRAVTKYARILGVDHPVGPTALDGNT